MTTEPVSGSQPQMSIVLATDAFDTVRPVLAVLRQQTARSELEILLVMPTGTRGSIDWDQLDVFRAVRLVDVDAPLSLPVARAAGVRAASAPIVFIGETHCFPRPGMSRVVASAFKDDRCAAVVPAIVNANPATALSWASFLTDYGRWGPGRPAGVLDRPVLYNGAYRRAALVAFGDRLDELLDANSEELWPLLHGQGYHALFEPDAQTDHVNATMLRAMLRIRLYAGNLIGRKRARRWNLLRRLAYVAASPLIPVVLTWRAHAIARYGAPDRKLPFGTIPAVALGATAKTIGEVLGYLGINLRSAEPGLTHNELHKLRYARIHQQ